MVGGVLYKGSPSIHPATLDYDPDPNPPTLTVSSTLSSLRTCSTISLQDDLDVEEGEEFLVMLTPQNVVGSFVFTSNETTVIIQDNDLDEGTYLGICMACLLHVKCEVKLMHILKCHT